MEQGNPESKRRIETRILHHERLQGPEDVGDQLWRGYTYIWNDTQTDAELLENSKGRDRLFVIRDASAPGGKREQVWRFPSRAECTLCHTMAAKYALGVNMLQMNKLEHGKDGAVNQLTRLEGLGAFAKPLLACDDEQSIEGRPVVPF